jgi:protein gp37
MNITKIEWTDVTLNPVVGCPHGCVYCYARRQVKRQLNNCELCYRFIPHHDLERLDHLKPTQKPKKIFIDSMWDWNADGVKENWLIEILNKMEECLQHTFQILSKRPEKYSRFKYPENVWLGTSITSTDDIHRVTDLLNINLKNIKFVSIEPIHERIDFWFTKINWIIVGAETGNRNNKIIPKNEWIESITKNARDEKNSHFYQGQC